MSPIDLTEVLKDAPAGDWIALAADESRILATAAILEDAIELAQKAGEEHPIVIKVAPVSALVL